MEGLTAPESLLDTATDRGMWMAMVFATRGLSIGIRVTARRAGTGPRLVIASSARCISRKVGGKRRGNGETSSAEAPDRRAGN